LTTAAIALVAVLSGADTPCDYMVHGSYTS
jgi:hypothetical protein